MFVLRSALNLWDQRNWLEVELYLAIGVKRTIFESLSRLRCAQVADNRASTLALTRHLKFPSTCFTVGTSQHDGVLTARLNFGCQVLVVSSS